VRNWKPLGSVWDWEVQQQGDKKEMAAGIFLCIIRLLVEDTCVEVSGIIVI